MLFFGKVCGTMKSSDDTEKEEMIPRQRMPLEISNGLGADIRAWCRGRSGFIRIPLWLYLAYVGVEQYREPETYDSIFAAINLGIHEGGHILFRPFGEFLHVAGGTIAQLAAPVIAMFILWKQRDYFGITFCLGWLSTNLVGVGVYMADARDMALPLVSAEGAGSEKPIIMHDWNNLFGQLGLLDEAEIIGLATRSLGSAIMAIALLSGAWLIATMCWPQSQTGRAGK
jgi:hypothetical protein